MFEVISTVHSWTVTVDACWKFNQIKTFIERINFDCS